MGNIISVANQKGGVGKTTSAINMSSILGELGKKTLLIDGDPQGNATSGLGYNPNEMNTTIYDVLVEDEEIKSTIIQTDFDNLFLIPANIHLSGVQIELLTMEDKEYRLKQHIDKIKDEFDYIVIDLPPSLGILTLNGLTASNSVLIPLQCEYYALEGLSQLLKVISLVQKELNTNLVLNGVLLTMYDTRTKLSQQVVDDVKEYFGDKTYNTIIPRNVRLSESPSFGKPINYYDKNSSGYNSYLNFVKEFISNG